MQPIAKAEFQLLYQKIFTFFGRERYKYFHLSLTKYSRKKRFAYHLSKLAMRFYLTRVFGVIFLIFWWPNLHPLPTDKLVFYGPTANNKRVLNELFDVLKEPSWGHPDNLSARMGFLRRFCFVIVEFKAIRLAAQLMQPHRKINAFAAMQMLLSGAARVFYQKNLSQDRPEAIAFANDHSPLSVALRMTATNYGIKTIYRQHAPISTEFLPLEFDLAFLFDQTSLDRYAAVGQISGQAVVWSPFKTDYKKMIIPQTIEKVGVCLSLVWEVNQMKATLHSLLQHDSLKEILLRPHPADQNDLNVLCFHPKIKITKKHQAVAKYCDSCDVIVVPTSGVALEVLHLGVPVLYAANKNAFDYDGYGFVAEGILPDATTNISDLDSAILYFDADWLKRFMRFDATINRGQNTDDVHYAMHQLIDQT